jgi:hypothetical protein
LSEKRKAREITKKEDIDYFLSLSEDECLRMSFIAENFGSFDDKKPKFNTYDIITIPALSYSIGNKKNTKPFRTTLGLWVFNKGLIEKDFGGIIGYVNYPITKKGLAKINKTLSYALLEDRITIDQLKRFIMKTQKCQAFVTILSSNQTLDILLCSKKIDTKKQELAKKYNEGIKNGDLVTVTKMEKELLDYSKDLLDGDPSLDYFNSGAGGSFGNNFKNMYIMKGAMKDPDPTKGYNVSLSNYSSGISKDEYSMVANSLAAGPYARGKKTKNGGYLEKLLLSACQHIILDEPGSDCGTKRYVTVKLTDDNISDWMYSYIVDGSRLVEITSQNRDKYIGKTVKMRYSSLCEGKQICNKCAGNLYYRLGIRNVGSTMPKIGSTLKNISMKAFHDSVPVLTEMDPMKAFGIS